MYPGLNMAQIARIKQMKELDEMFENSKKNFET